MVAASFYLASAPLASIPIPTSYTGGRGLAINNSNQAVGFVDGGTSPRQAYRYDPFTGTTLLGIIDGKGSMATAINNAGTVVGQIDSGAGLAFLWTPPVLGTPGTPSKLSPIQTDKWLSSSPEGLNNPSGTNPLLVVGYAKNLLQEGRAFLWDSSSLTMQDLNVITVDAPQWGLFEA